jgi:hypothetical protein
VKGGKKAVAVPVAAPIVRQRDGSHHLVIGRLLDPARGAAPADEQPPPMRGATVGRLVLSGDKRGGGAARGRGAPLYYECNGLVLDARSWRPLAVPPNAFNLRPQARAVDDLLAARAYDIIRVDDGTVVTLYCWNHPTDGAVWALASSNGYDVSSLYWIGPLTYAAVFYEITQRLYPVFGATTGMSLETTYKTMPDGSTRLASTRLKFTNLDPRFCYTVGLRHHNFHPVRADPERVWQIQCTDLSGATPQVVFSPQALSGGGPGLPGIPGQTVYPDLEALAAACAGAEAPGQAGEVTVERLSALGKDAFARACAFIDRAHREGAPPAGSPLPPELNYGFILRSRDPARTGEYSDILIETPLLARVRKIVYERAPRAVRDSLTAEDRLEYSALRAFLTANERPDFLALCPDWADRFRGYGEFVDNVIHLVVHTLRQRAMLPTSREPRLDSATGRVAKALLEHICRHENLGPFHKDTELVVRDYVVNPEYAYLFLRTLNNGPSPSLLSAGAGGAPAPRDPPAGPG